MKIFKFLFLLALLALALSCKEHTTELLTIPDPVLSPLDPVNHTYFSGQAVTVTCNEIGAKIYYTVDGTDPTEEDSLLFTVASGDNSGELIIPEFFPAGADSTVLKVKAFKTGMNPSNVISGTYAVVYFQTVGTPIFLPASGNITTATEISIFCTPASASIYYTLDGSEPTPASTLYAGPFTIAQTGAVTVKARGYNPMWNKSEIATANYTVTAK